MTARLSRAVNIEDLRELARDRVPRIVFNYIDGGAEGEWTLRENRRAFDTVTFRPRQAVAVTECDLRTRVLGVELSMPLLLAPVGYLRVMHPGGEIAAARGCDTKNRVADLPFRRFAILPALPENSFQVVHFCPISVAARSLTQSKEPSPRAFCPSR